MQLRCAVPDLVESRGERHLLVWGAQPYWLVCDSAFREFLGRLDGTAAPAEILRRRNLPHDERKAVAQQLKVLQKAGVLHKASIGAMRSGSEEDPGAGLPIENLALNLTRRCNLRCRFCYNLPYLTTDNSKELTADEIEVFLGSTRPHLAKQPVLNILGGEPLTNVEKLFSVLAAARRYGFRPMVSTNGTRIDDAFAAKARAEKLEVQISVDGPTAELNDAVRGEGVFARIEAGLATLRRHGVHSIVSMVCHVGNLDALPAFYEWAAAHGANEARFIPLKRMGGQPDSSFQPASLPNILSVARKLFAARPDLRALAGRDAFSVMGNTCRFSVRRRSCGTGSQTLLLDSDGTLYPCLNTNHPALRIANIRDPGFEFASVWRSSPVLRQLRAATAIASLNERCSNCPVRNWCLGGCRGETFLTESSVSEPAWNCSEQRRAVLDTFWVLAEQPELVKAAARIC